MTDKHTKLPWKVFNSKDGAHYLGVGELNGAGVLDCGFGVWRDGPEAAANAEFIVRACTSHDLLVAALEGPGQRESIVTWLRALIAFYVTEVSPTFEGIDIINLRIEEIEAALSKAKGESQLPASPPCSGGCEFDHRDESTPRKCMICGHYEACRCQETP